MSIILLIPPLDIILISLKTLFILTSVSISGPSKVPSLFIFVNKKLSIPNF